MGWSWRQSPVIRKSVLLGRRPPRVCRRLTSPKEAWTTNRPVLVNSFPKSGTHLLMQIVDALPGLTNYGVFLASTPPIRFRERTRAQTVRKIHALVPGEVMGAHLFFSDDYAAALRDRQATHLFIYRDPRDVVVSESHYLTHMNRWHRLHPRFKALADDAERISFSIRGDGPDSPHPYPDIGKRFERYHGWLGREDVIAVRFEDLVSESLESTLRTLVQRYAASRDEAIDEDATVAAAMKSVRPDKSHTFRKGEAGGWRKHFTDEHRAQFKQAAGELLIELGYETDLNW